LPGYDHSVPPGQVSISPSGTNKPSVHAHVIDSTSQNIFEDEDEDEDEWSESSPLPKIDEPNQALDTSGG
jgi:hypothetical protein